MHTFEGRMCARFVHGTETFLIPPYLMLGLAKW